MRLTLSSLLLAAAGAAQAAAAAAAPAWSFADGSIAVAAKGSGGGGGGPNDATVPLDATAVPLSEAVALGSHDVATLRLTTKDGSGKGKRPHQAFLLLQDPASGLEAPFPLTVKASGEGSVQLAHKDIPGQLLAAAGPLRASLVVGSFGSEQGYAGALFDVAVVRDASLPAPAVEAPVRYGKQPAIHHTFRADPRSPPAVISAFFVLAVATALPMLLGVWLLLGANLNHLGRALAAAPVSHAAFFGSLLAMEGVFFLYYTRWNLFQMLPVAGLVGTVTVLSGSKALGEVQARRLAGER